MDESERRGDRPRRRDSSLAPGGHCCESGTEGVLRILESVDVATIQQHLKSLGTGVNLDLATMPGKPDEYRGFSVLLDSQDVDRIILWFEFRKHTADGSCRVSETLPETRQNPRVKRIIEGDPKKGWGPMDLADPRYRMVIATDDPTNGILHVIDGNHRAMASQSTGKGFQDVPAYVRVHPLMQTWAYFPKLKFA